MDIEATSERFQKLSEEAAKAVLTKIDSVAKDLSGMGIETPEEVKAKLAVIEQISKGEKPEFQQFLEAYGALTLWLAQVDMFLSKTRKSEEPPAINDNWVH
jgi:hypothetical protein